MKIPKNKAIGDIEKNYIEKNYALFVGNWRRRIARIDPFKASKDEQKMFYRLILGVRWLEPEIWDTVLAKGLGISVGAYKALWLEGWARQTQYNIDQRVHRMEENNERRGRRPPKAMKDEAKSQGIELTTMKRRLQRLGRKQG
jgi:hypothetical protein